MSLAQTISGFTVLINPSISFVVIFFCLHIFLLSFSYLPVCASTCPFQSFVHLCPSLSLHLSHSSYAAHLYTHVPLRPSTTWPSRPPYTQAPVHQFISFYSLPVPFSLSSSVSAPSVRPSTSLHMSMSEQSEYVSECE